LSQKSSHLPPCNLSDRINTYGAAQHHCPHPPRKTYPYTLPPTSQQERAREHVLWRCRTLSTCALEQRITWWRRGQGRAATRFQQEAELKDLRAAFPNYAASHSPVRQDVLARRDQTSQASLRRRASGEKPGVPRFQGHGRSHSCTSKE